MIHMYGYLFIGMHDNLITAVQYKTTVLLQYSTKQLDYCSTVQKNLITAVQYKTTWLLLYSKKKFDYCSTVQNNLITAVQYTNLSIKKPTKTKNSEKNAVKVDLEIKIKFFF